MSNRTVAEVEHTEKMMREARLAERERCAKIANAEFAYFAAEHAKAVEADNSPVYQAMSIGMACAEKIAIAIRNQ